VLCLIGIVVIALFILPLSAIWFLRGGLILGVLWIVVSSGIFFHRLLAERDPSPRADLVPFHLRFDLRQNSPQTRKKNISSNSPTRDGLTGLFVIRHFRNLLNENGRYSRATKRSFAIIPLSISMMKQINDILRPPGRGRRSLNAFSVMPPGLRSV